MKAADDVLVVGNGRKLRYELWPGEKGGFLVELQCAGPELEVPGTGVLQA